MNRRQYISTVGGIALTPSLSLADAGTRTDTRLTPEQYKRRVPNSLAGFEVNHQEHELESFGRHIYSLYSKHSPYPSITYTEHPPDTEGGSQIIADIGRLRYGFETVSGAAQFVNRFLNRVEYTSHWNNFEGAKKYFYDEYSVDRWTLTVQRKLGSEGSSTTAIIDGERVEFESPKERFRVVKKLIQEKI